MTSNNNHDETGEKLYSIQLLKQKAPLISVSILNHTFPALLDTGSPISILGNDVIELIHLKNIKPKTCFKPLSFLQGNYVCTQSVILKIKYDTGIRRQLFYMVPGSIRSILLGRDFLGIARIGIHIGNNGWSCGNEKIITFIDKNEHVKLSSTGFTKVNKSMSEIMPSQNVDTHDLIDLEEDNVFHLDYKSPSEILSQWDFPVSEEPHEFIEQTSLNESWPESLYAPDYLLDDQKENLESVIAPFLPIFTKVPGLCTLYTHSIDTQDHNPVSTTLRPMSMGKRAIFDNTFDELLKYDIIEPCKSPWACNGLVVPKKDGGLRFVVDYKALNRITVTDNYPMPRIDDMIAILGKASYFSTFDLCKGFHQIAMNESDKSKTTFISHRGSWQFKRMPMGLKNSPATFQRCVDAVLGDIKWVYCAVYFDDIVVFSETFEDHLIHVAEVLRRIRNAGLTINPNKIQLCRKQFKFLGFIIEPNKCYPDPAKVAVLNNYPIPKNPKQIQKFLGLAGFYRRFIDKFSLIAKPLTTLIQKNTKFIWSEEAQNAFDKIRNALTKLSMVYLPDLNSPFIIQTDASEVGLGAVLLQEKDSLKLPIWFASRALKPAELKYSVSEKECLAVVWAIEKFRGYIEYTHFTIQTDHQALAWLQKLKEPAGRLARWFMTLQMYNFDVMYRPGDSVNMRGADALSRIPELVCLVTADPLDRMALISEQNADPVLKEVILYHKNENHFPQSERLNKIRSLAKFSNITDDGLLMKYVGPKGKPWQDESLYYRVWIPKKFQEALMKIFHSDILSAHLGIRKTYLKLEQRVYWEGMRKDVTNFVRRCIKCQESQLPKTPLTTGTSLVPEYPWDVISIDLMGPFPRGSNQHTHLLVVVDNFSKFIEIIGLRKTNAGTIIEKLWSLFCRWGLPKTIISDNATQFSGKEYRGWCDMLNINPFFISAYHAQANMTERYNQTIKKMIITTSEKIKHWDLHLNEIAFALRTAVSDSTGFTPAFVMTGREYRTPFDNLVGLKLPNNKVTGETIMARMNSVYNIIREEILNSQDVYLKYYNRNTKQKCFKIGDLVLCKTHFLSDASKGFTAKLAPKRDGPYRVIEIVTPNVYDIEHIDTHQKIMKAHANELSPFFSI